MFGEHEDAKVLAEYIVVMAAGNKGPEEMTVELKPFFHEAEQAESFVDWVEECKWRFLTGEPASPKKAAGDGVDSPLCHSPSPIRRMDSPEDDVSEPVLLQHQAAAGGKLVRRAAGASRAALPVMSPPAHSRPKPLLSSPAANGSSVFEVGVSVSAPAKATTSASLTKHGAALATASTRAAQATMPSTSSQSSSAAVAPVFSKSVAAARTVGGPTTVKREKNELLKNMTKQLQVILTKLNDRSLNDGMRERYQAMAQSVQAQMAKLSRPQSTKRRI
jgi:hypothetical protein